MFVYDDYVELILHYTNSPNKPKDRIDDKEETEYKEESPEGVSLRGSLIYKTECSYDMYSYKGRNKKGLEPIFKGDCKMSVFIEI